MTYFPSSLPGGECPNCGFKAWSRSANLASCDSERLNDRIDHRRLVKRNQYLNRAGSKLSSLYVIYSGFLKTSITDDGGREQITGFSMAGELVGLDSIGTGKHQCDTVAIEDSHLCEIAYSDFARLSCDIPSLQHHFHRMMGAEIARDHGIMLLLGAMRAEERIAMFLLNLSIRFSARGYSETQFRLPMARQDIGSYLGMTVETVSRTFSQFNNLRLIAINGRYIEIRDLPQLRQLIGDRGTRDPLPRRAGSGAN